jgi:YidC/Oxa1 family membrane protein insertase
MGMDRNTVIGFVLLGLLLFAYLFIATKNNQEAQKNKQLLEDSVKLEQAKQQIIRQDTSKAQVVLYDTTGFNKSVHGSEQLLTVENEVLRIVFTNKGAQPKFVDLKGYQTFHQAAVRLVGSDNDVLSYPVNTGPNQTMETTDLFFTPQPIVSGSDGSKTVTYLLNGPGGEQVLQQYILRKGSYFVDMNIQLNGADRLLSQSTLNLNWHLQLRQQEKVVRYERMQSELCYVLDGDFDYHNLSGSDQKKFDRPVAWVSAKQQFFNSTLIAQNRFDGGEASWSPPSVDTLPDVALLKFSLHTKLNPGAVASLPLQLYYGPNDYRILHSSDVSKMDKIINLGQGFYSFVRPVNIYVIMPVFDFFKKLVSSYGLVILLLTLFIRLLTSPLVYSSYLSGAKMKALRPEIEAMKKRVGSDQQQAGMEQMKLFREAGVNPLGGCIPALLQIPIFFALYSFFNSNIELRGQSFLWSKDLSVFDSIANFGFSVPIYGDHISLFALLAVVTSFVISLYGMSLTPDQSNPAMKYMPYIMPVMLLFFFNNLPAALTWYYTVSNMITLILQWVIQTYIIDHDKILAKLKENRNKPRTKPKWQERLEQMQESQKKMQQIKRKS